MDVAEYIRKMGERAKESAAALAKLSTDEKNAALAAIADALESRRAEIGAANAADVARAKETGISPSMVDRLTLTLLETWDETRLPGVYEIRVY